MNEHTAKNDAYPRLVDGRWIKSPLEHLALYADRAEESYAAVPVRLLVLASRFRECSARKIFDSDEDGPIPPLEAICRRQDGHAIPANPDHVREHSNGYYTWADTRVIPPERGQP